jgi:hypothetical protein
MRRIRSRYLAGYVIASDVLLLAFALPLQRYALEAAASPASGAALILGLLALNVLLLVAIGAAAVASCSLGARVAARVFRRRS